MPYNDSAAKASNGSLLVVAEPMPQQMGAVGGIPRTDRTLLILPKWRGSADPDRPGWVDHVALWPGDFVERVLLGVLPYGEIKRPSHDIRWADSRAQQRS